MINTKIIFVDGITGSGKSTITHFIARQLEQNGIKARWFHEEEEGNPFWLLDRIKDETDELFTKRVLRDFI